jgi:hypothetical protein
MEALYVFGMIGVFFLANVLWMCSCRCCKCREDTPMASVVLPQAPQRAFIVVQHPEPLDLSVITIELPK